MGGQGGGGCMGLMPQLSYVCSCCCAQPQKMSKKDFSKLARTKFAGLLSLYEPASYIEDCCRGFRELTAAEQ